MLLCTQAIFQSLRGVNSVLRAIGRHASDPTYEDVCTGNTGHAEVIKLEFDPSQISFNDLLTVFFATHDPTTLNRQGNDVGTQYRSIVLFTTDEQKRAAEAFIKKLDGSDPKGRPVVTEVEPLTQFYEAEDYHRDYFKNHRMQSYCQVIIEPKAQKLEKEFSALLEEKSKT